MSKTKRWLALDIGGANLKIADGVGFAATEPFALWRQPHALADSLHSLISAAPSADQLAITMTGELADCYRTKNDGVIAILQAAEQAAAGRPTQIYRTDGSFATLADALSRPEAVAASNWHALAQYAGRLMKHGVGLLIDIGSTTTDLVGFLDGSPDIRAATDTDRLASGELLYTGVLRTPVATVVSQLPYRGLMCSVARELFATMQDVYITLSDLEEERDNHHTADGRAATREASYERLARMICADRNTFDSADAAVLAEFAARSQRGAMLAAARRVIDRLPQPPQTVVISGRGEFVARQVANEAGSGTNIIALSETLGQSVSVCAPAHALAVLAREMNP